MTAFAGKVVWMTGAGTGIGKAGALMFAQEGAAVALIGRRRDKLDEVAAEIQYSASKFGMLGMSLSLTQEAWKFGIRACCPCPDDINTPIMARRKVKYPPEVLDQFIQPEDLAETMKFVALMPRRTSIPEMLIYPTNVRPYTPAESGLTS